MIWTITKANIIKNFSLYRVYFLATIGLFTVFTAFLTFTSDKMTLAKIAESGQASAIANISLTFLIVFLTIFLMYFSGARKRLRTTTEMNIYSFILYGFVISLCAFGFAGGGRLTLVFMYVIPVVLTYLKKYTGEKGAWYYPWCFALFCLIILQLYIAYDPMKYDYKTIFESATYYML